MRFMHFALRRSLKRGNQLRIKAFFLASLVFSLPLLAQNGPINKAPDIAKVPTLYVVPYPHLDTQWRWEVPRRSANIC
jgi:alpha-mannosidase